MSTAMNTAAFDTQPASASAVAATYDNAILLNRWLGAWVDFIVLVLLLVVPQALLGTPLYQKLLWLWLGLIAAYFPVMEAVFGKTVGKFVTRTRVVNARGGRPSWVQAIVRTLLRLVEVNPLLVGGVPAGIAVLASRHKQRLGDMVAGTYVLRDRDVARMGAPAP